MSLIMDRLLAICHRGSEVILTDSKASWTGDTLGRRIDEWLAFFDTFGSRRVAWQLPNGADWIAIDIALLQSRRIAVPVPDFFTPEQVSHVLDTAGIDTWVGAQGLTPAAFGSHRRVEDLEIAHRGIAQAPPVHAGTAKITFTSGSTGTPRGVCLSRDKMLRTAEVLQARFADRDIRAHLSVLPLALLLENVAGVYANLLNGSALHAPALGELGMTGSSTLDVGRFVSAQQRFAPHSLILVPQLLLAMLGALARGATLPDSYRFIAVGGARVSGQLIAMARHARLPVYEGYGLSECGSVVALNMPGVDRAGSVGRPLDHVDIAIRDGEIQVAGAGMLGYLGGPPSPPTIATGDLGHFDAEGFLYIDGRRKHCFITAFGRNVNPEWIESELTAEPEIAQAAAFGEALPGNIGVIVPRVSDATAIAHAVERANRRLPDYARITEWVIVDPVEFRQRACITSSGKLRRDKVANAYAADLAAAASRLHAAVEPPRSEHVL